ncbi:MAG: hypothetical protein MZV70_22275 [Desulfobacterales bacterium]|nr:hypothetical protein [Desulfobacterales bacterium]
MALGDPAKPSAVKRDGAARPISQDKLGYLFCGDLPRIPGGVHASLRKIFGLVAAFSEGQGGSCPTRAWTACTATSPPPREAWRRVSSWAPGMSGPWPAWCPRAGQAGLDIF